MSEDQLEWRDMTCDTINSLLNKADPLELNRAVDIAMRSCEEYFEPYNLLGNYCELRRSFESAYLCMSNVLDYQSREVLTWRCEHNYAEQSEVLLARLAKAVDISENERRAVRALCNFWQKFNEIEGSAK